ncbi:MFS transporter [Isoptericola sp. NEAU-Y5]|uniref:MFS transporter n=1 Tax=Isoptericola luteus TaxID=2879484 RepID=A0ABS7ZAZ5_9MICO|nr:MFS transporter [Isoptericola sp. NEAU-Y5]MCA5892210.1 MFS transporter [Isoptericola sp. NEAU-Y5]
MTTPMRAVPAARPRTEALGARAWLTVVVVGLVGQLAWTVENMYLNVFVYDTISTDPTVLAVLVAASAIAATVATFLVGTWSDRVARRRPFIAAGYVLWGATTAAFGLVSPSAAAPVVTTVGAAVVTIVVLDCAMSVFGSGANDAAFNAWVTETTTPANRGRVDGVLAIMPLVAMLVVFGVLDPLTRAGRWELFFGLVGGATAAVGVLAAFLVREPVAVRPPADGYLAALVHGLRPATVRRHPRLYLLLAAWAVVGTSTQVFLPYLIIYIQRYLRIEAYALVLATVLVAASLVSVLGGRVIDRVGKQRMILPAAAVLAAGLLGMFVARGTVPVIVAGAVMMSGFLLAVAALAASVRDATPAGRVGMVQGLRMIAMVAIPMVAGPFLGAWVITGANETYVDLGVVKQVPTPWIFVAAAVVALLVVVPVAFLRRLAPQEARR